MRTPFLIISMTLFLFLTAGMNSKTFGQNFYDINTINTIEIIFSQSNWDFILDSLVADGLEERLLGSVYINGEFFDSVGVRYKGNSSYSPDRLKNPLNIKLDYIIDEQLIEEYGTLKLANAFKDPSFVRETLSYEIARKYIPASLSNYANVYINGTYLGLYTNDQDVDKFFMRTHFSSDENARIKGEVEGTLPPDAMGGVWEYFGTDESSYYSLYALESDFGWQDLIAFLDTLNNQENDIEEVLNIDRHLWFLAFENLLVNLDSPINNPQNYYIYKDDAGRFNPIPWDLNESFGVFAMLQSSGPLNLTQLQQLDPFVNLNNSEYPVISKILSNERYRKMYIAHMKTMIEENFADGSYKTRALEIQNIIDSDVQADPNKFYTYNDFLINIYNSVGGGLQSIVGIAQLMDARINYLNNLTAFQYIAPEITNITHTPTTVSANSEVWLNAEVNNANIVKLAYRFSQTSKFEKVDMYDDGNHNDGAAGDGVYGAPILAESTNVQYYIYAENNNAVKFSPERAEYEFYTITVNTTNSSDIVMNEIYTRGTTADPDWIEIFNSTTSAIDISGYKIYDSGGQSGTKPKKEIPTGTVIPPNGFWVIVTDDTSSSGFGLSSSGEKVWLENSTGLIVDSVIFPALTVDQSYGRIPDGGVWQILDTLSRGVSNGSPTGIEDENLSITNYMLNQNYPNPFNPTTTISFQLPIASQVTLKIYDILGKEVATLVDEMKKAGNYQVKFDATQLASGMYFYRLDTKNFSQVRKMILMK